MNQLAEWNAFAFPLLGIGLLVFMNVAAFAAFKMDKARAVRNEWRVSESALLWLAFLGGWLGAKIAQRRFRHKTRKQPFVFLLNAIPVIWVVLIGFTWVEVRYDWHSLIVQAGWMSGAASGISGTIPINRPSP